MGVDLTGGRFGVGNGCLCVCMVKEKKCMHVFLYGSELKSVESGYLPLIEVYDVIYSGAWLSIIMEKL